MQFKNQIKNILISTLTLSAIGLSGCTTSDFAGIFSQGSAVSTTGTKLSNVDPDKVKLYYANAGLPKHYIVIGRVAADNYNFISMQYSQEKIAQNLKQEAASIGANGVINITNGMTQTTGDAIRTE
jgi:hypothetical protein